MSRNTFLQDPPHLGNQFLEDKRLIAILETNMPEEMYKDVVKPDLTVFGKKVATNIKDLGDAVERHPPTLTQYDAWQNRIDRIETHPAWKQLHELSASEGLISIGYERSKFGQYSRLYQFAKMYLFDASAGLYTCPLAMTDGAARVFEIMLNKCNDENERQKFGEVFSHLISRDAKSFWTSGQWMTEKTGGSDVSRTETYAVKQEDGTYRLNGFKWFTSATDANMTLALAKVKQPLNGISTKSNTPQASKKGTNIQLSERLSLFFIKLRDDDTGKLNGLKIHKLKDKLGTKGVPTAELSLKNTKAILIGEEGRGTANITTMLNITRIFNCVGACSAMRRIVALVQDYSGRRLIGSSQKLVDKPLHVHQFAKIVAEQEACLLLSMHCCSQLGKVENGESTEQENSILRLMIPIAKLYTGKKAVNVVSEGMEAIGGMAYIEDTKIPRLLRNAQVLPIWEGTTNVLSLDVIRVLIKQPKTLMVHWKQFIDSVVAECQNRVMNSDIATLKGEQKQIILEATQQIKAALGQILQYTTKAFDTKNMKLIEAGARELAFSIAHVHISALILSHIFKVLDLAHTDHGGVDSVKQNEDVINREVTLLYQYLSDHKPLCIVANELLYNNSPVWAYSGEYLLGKEKEFVKENYETGIKSKY